MRVTKLYKIILLYGGVTPCPSFFLSTSLDGGKLLHLKALRMPFHSDDYADDRHQDLQLALARIRRLRSKGLESFEKELEKVYVDESTMLGAGKGLFARRQIKAGTIVAFYPVHAIGADFGSSSVSVGATPADQDFFNNGLDGRVTNYVQYLVGSRAIGTADFGDYCRLFIDANPSRRDEIGWLSHRTNDGATVLENSAKGMLDYYAESRERKNCIIIPIGPAPLMATITTKNIDKGQELLTTYGCSYWLAALCGDETETAEITDAVVQEAAAVAKDIFVAMRSAQTKYETQLIELHNSFYGPTNLQ
jgi:hypothetical protein